MYSNQRTFFDLSLNDLQFTDENVSTT